MSRSLAALQPELQQKYRLFEAAMVEANIHFILTCTDRTIIEQMALFSMGRMDLADVNTFRAIAGLPAIIRQENVKVTWTLNSKHVTNMFDADLNNDRSRAFDIALLKAGKPHWDIKVSVNGNEIPDYEEAGKIGESVGLIWGGRWKKPDYPHFEL